MKGLRKQEVSIRVVDEFEVGDRIQIDKYTATCQEVTKKGVLFILDQYLDRTFKMNLKNTNRGGYDFSNLREELQNNSILEIFDSVRDMMIPFENGDLIRIPYAEEFFGDVDECEPSRKSQLPLMKDPRNRIATCASKNYEWGWLQNKSSDSFTCFTVVVSNGDMSSYRASNYCGVRPVFQLYF